MLRLKRETDDALGDERLRADPEEQERLEEQDHITSRDAFPDGDTEWDRPRLPTLPLRGLAIAGASFVPTFLLVFFGVPYMLAPDGPIHAAIATVRSASEAPAQAPPAPPPVTRSEPARSSAPGRTAVQPPAPSTPLPDAPKADERPPWSTALPPALPPSAPLSSPRSARVEPPATPEPPAAEATREPSLPPASRRPNSDRRPGQDQRSAQEARSSREARPNQPSQEGRKGGAARDDARVADSRVVDAKPAGRDTSDWTPAAAFTDRAAASRLASSIEKQGYPVEIRQDGSSTRPWVVWIGAQPSGGTRRR
jgi:hypothetical protein